MADNQGNQNKGCWVKIFHLLTETRKTTDFTSLRVNSREIIQVTPKYQLDFFNKTCRKCSKKEQVNITIEFYIFEIL